MPKKLGGGGFDPPPPSLCLLGLIYNVNWNKFKCLDKILCNVGHYDSHFNQTKLRVYILAILKVCKFMLFLVCNLA